MKASVGDRIVIASNRLDHPLRDGRIIECRHEDGTPPNVVEWSGSGNTGLFFPGPDAQVQHPVGEIPTQPKAEPPAEGEIQPQRHVKTWHVEVSLFEADGDTTAHAVLVVEDIPSSSRPEPHRPRPDQRSAVHHGARRSRSRRVLGTVVNKC
jgi:hypothetical protein